ncbi:MAG: chemotaxis protein CheB [Burkholderiaceae bacterium]
MGSTPPSRLIVIGASAGGVETLLTIAAGLPSDFAAPVLVVLHIGARHSYLPELLRERGASPAKFGGQGEVPQPGTIYVAPSDHHMLIEGGRIRISRGPKEQHTRPAIDPLFRSAALDSGANAVGVILTGMLDDGSAGLRAIKDCGGVAVVQDPSDAQEPSMPLNALSNVEVDHVVTAREMPALLCRLASTHNHMPTVEAPAALRLQHAVSLGGNGMDELSAIGAPSAFTCPDCGGALFELHDKRPVRFVCHTGHAYSLRTLAFTHAEVTEAALWSSLRALQEKEAILRRLAAGQAEDSPGSESSALSEAEQLASVVAVLRRFAEQTPSSRSFETST